MDNQSPAEPAQASSQPAPVAWVKYIRHIVRWEDGTCWLVKEDGRHWVPDGGVYQILVQKGSQVFNLPSQELDTIPDIKGSHAIG